MKNATRLLVPALSLGLLVKSLAIGHALAFTLYVDSDPANPAPSRDYQTVGAVTGPNSNPALGPYTNLFGASPIESYSTPSVVNFGVTQTFGAPGSDAVANTAAFDGGVNSTVSFTFDLQNGVAPGSASVPSAVDGAFSRFVVTGSLLGSVGFPTPHAGNSTTNIIFSSVTNLDAGGGQVSSILSTNPNDGLAALKIIANIGGQNYDIYLDDIQDISAPGKDALSITGYITTEDVPEPGSMALLLGVAVTGTALLRRRRRK